MDQRKNKETAIKIATFSVPKFYEGEDLNNIFNLFLNNIDNYDTINYIYAVDKENRLTGIISIKVLLNKERKGLLLDVMEKNLIKVTEDTDREKVAHLAIKHNLKSIPIVNKKNNFLGIVSSDTILEVLQEEYTEDSFIAGGLLIDESIKDIENTSVKQFILLRSPWLILGLFGGIIAAKVMGQFEEIISSFITLSFFIPIIVYLSGAISTQSATIFIRAMTINNKISFLKYFIRELKISFFLGIILGGMLGFVSYLGWNNISLSLILFLSVFFGSLFAAIFAVSIPLIFWKIKKDPALGTNPLITIISDVMSIAVYLFISLIILKLL